MHPRLFAIWDRLHRAQEHFETIEGMLIAHYNANLGVLRGDFDPDREPLVRIDDSGVGLPDTRLHTITGELLHDLRSALEHLVYMLVIDNGGEPTENTHFPVMQVRPPANTKGIHPPPRIAGGVSAAARTLIDAAQPYQWDAQFAEHPIWILHSLWNIDKHRHIALRGLRMDGYALATGTPRFTFTMHVGNVTVDGAELILVPDDPSMNVDIRATTQVFLREPKHGVATPLRGTLKDIIDAVVFLVEEAQNRCFQPLTSPTDGT